MANLGDARGTISVDRDFFYKYKEVIEKIRNDEDYSLIFTGLTNHEMQNINDDGKRVSFSFQAGTRWCMESTVTMPTAWGTRHSKEWEDILLKEQPLFILEYDEYECGMGILANEVSRVQFENVDNQLNISCDIIDHEDYLMTDRNRIRLEFEEGVSSDELEGYYLFKRVYEDRKDDLGMSYTEFAKKFKEVLDNDSDYDGYICDFKLDDSGYVEDIIYEMNQNDNALPLFENTQESDGIDF